MHCRSTQAPLSGSGSCLDPRLPAGEKDRQSKPKRSCGTTAGLVVIVTQARPSSEWPTGRAHFSR